MAVRLLQMVSVPHEQRHRAISIIRQIGMLGPDCPNVRAAKTVLKLIANSPSVDKFASMEMAQEAGPDGTCPAAHGCQVR